MPRYDHAPGDTTSRAGLLAALRELDAVPSEEWLEALPPRKVEEMEFHDMDRLRQSPDQVTPRETGNRRFYKITSASRKYVDAWIRSHAPGKVVLDYACGNGNAAIAAARAGASLAVGIDLSPVSVANARTDARRAGVEENTFFVQADCEDTRLPDRSVDVVVCRGMLHHLDLEAAFPELRRILKPGGVVLGMEALAYNPAIRLYRRLTPGMRTAWEVEHILSWKDLRFASTFFDVRNVRYWHLTAIPVAFLAGTPLFRPLKAVADGVDAVITRVPGLRLMSWILTFELHRTAPQDGATFP